MLPAILAANIGDEARDLLGGLVVRRETGEDRVRPAIVPMIFPWTLSDEATAPAVPSRVWMTMVFCAGVMSRTSSAIPYSRARAAARGIGCRPSGLPLGEVPAHGRLRHLYSEMRLSIPEAARDPVLVPLSTFESVFPILYLLLHKVLLEPLRVAERQVHVLHRRPGRPLEQIVQRREEQSFPALLSTAAESLARFVFAT